MGPGPVGLRSPDMTRSWITTYRFDLGICNSARSSPRRVCHNFMHDRYATTWAVMHLNDTEKS